MYAITDIETTGLGSAHNKITEIAIFIHDGNKVVDSFCTLINPECRISPTISMLTGIDDEMVKEAPKFYEVARDIYLLTEGRVFVAHNVNFDYSFLQAEFRRLGGEFRRKRLCTVRLSRKLIPGLPSYSLGKLCRSLHIEMNNRHRAAGDALATVKLFELLLQEDKEGFIDFSIKGNSKESTLPPNLPGEVFKKIPEKTGVYYFHDKDGTPIYIGKAKNIRSRVLSHFRGRADKPQQMLSRIFDITWTLTGSELLALLLESDEIKKHKPRYNRSQKRTNDIFGIYRYDDRKGYIHLGYERTNKLVEPVATFYNIPETRNFLQKLVEEYALCPKFCNLQSTPSACFNHQVRKCRGACMGRETPNAYNERVEQAIKKVRMALQSFLIVEKGRDEDESALVLVEDGEYKGFGFMGKENALISFEDAKEFILPHKDNRDVQRILHAYFNKNGVGNVVEKQQ